tara:strand:+ start:22 stop:1296 length:1275 start_codon:yes stop_codon:yes gene_type:complete
MALRDYLPWNRRKFASVGSNPPFAANEPRDFGAGVIKRIQLQKNGGAFGSAYEKQIGDARTYMNVYLADPIVRTLIDLPCLYAAKDGYDIVTDNDEERQAITKLFDDINIDQLLYGWLRNGRIFGTSYMEWTGDNLVLRSSVNMNVQRAANGQIMHYYQDLGDEQNSVRFEEDEIIEYKNNCFDDFAYGLSDIHPILYLVDLKDYAERDIGAALNKYANSRFDISCGLPDMPYNADKINEVVAAFNGLEPGEDIIHGNDITVKELQGTQRAFEYGKYTDDILKKIHIALKVPITMWEKPEQARPIFEPYVKHLQAAVESAINAQLMPQLESGDARFKFRQINVDDAFVKAKTDMVYLSEGVLSPSEVRMERGLNPEGIAEMQETAPNVNLSGGKDQDKQEESARTENRAGNEPAANPTGDRENE